LYAFFWVINPAFEFYIPTFRNTLWVGRYLPAYEDGTDSRYLPAYEDGTDSSYLPVYEDGTDSRYCTYLPMKMEQTVGTYMPIKINRQYSETSAYQIQTPSSYPQESTQLSEHDKSLKSSTQILFPPQTNFPAHYDITPDVILRKSCVLSSVPNTK